MSRRGLTLLEVVIAMLLVGILVTGFLRLQSSLFKGTRTALKQGAVVRALSLVREDLMRNDRFLPPQEFPATADPRNPATLNPFLDDPEMSGAKCYSRDGAEVDDCNDTAVFFRVRYVKFRQPDLNFYANADNPVAHVANEMNRIPLAFYRVRVDFTMDDEGKTPKTYYFTQYVTSVVNY